ncbi:MAG TPA: TPM domain-containing protein [Anaerolineales bacterium]
MKYLNYFFSFFLFLVLTLPISTGVIAQGATPPVPSPLSEGSYVLDQLGWLTPAHEETINTIVAKLDEENLAEIAVVTYDDCGPDSQSYRNTFFRTWGIGHKERNDGLLILVCWYGGDKSRRKLEQEVGYGMEGTIPDLLTSKVAEAHFIPVWKSGKDASRAIADGDAGAALVAMVKAYDSVIRGDTPEELAKRPSSSSSSSDAGFQVIGWLLFAAILIILLVVWWKRIESGSDDGSSSDWGSSDDWSSSDRDSSGGWDSSDDSDRSSFGGGSSGGGGSSSGF